MSLNNAIHRKIIVNILLDIYSDNTINSYLGFKGGTAAHLFYGLERFSVDLDFDLLDAVKEDYIFERIEKILKKYGAIKDARKKRFNLFFLLSYKNKQLNAQNVKVEINRRFFGSKYTLINYMGISMLVMNKEDMFANKLLAMRERLGNANRDIFDVWFFLKNIWDINKEIIKKRAGISYKMFLEKCITSLENFNDNNILDGLGELITEKQKMWVKEKLKSDTISLLKLMHSNEK